MRPQLIDDVEEVAMLSRLVINRLVEFDDSKAGRKRRVHNASTGIATVLTFIR